MDSKCVIEPTLFTKRVGGDFFICQLYVDDIIFGSSNTRVNDEFAKLMSDKFDIKQLREGTSINQANYTRDMLKRFKFEDAKGCKSSMSTSTDLHPNHLGKDVDQKLYLSMIGSLLCLCASWPDIMFSAGMWIKRYTVP